MGGSRRSGPALSMWSERSVMVVVVAVVVWWRGDPGRCQRWRRAGHQAVGSPRPASGGNVASLRCATDDGDRFCATAACTGAVQQGYPGRGASIGRLLALVI